MRKLVAFFCLITFSAFAGERLLGIVQTINTTKSNLSQNPDGGAFWWDGGFQQPFFVPEVSQVTIECSDPMFVCTDKDSCTAIEGLELGASVILPSSVGSASSTTVDVAMNPDAGMGRAHISEIKSARVSILPMVTDGGYKSCKVFSRNGKE